MHFFKMFIPIQEPRVGTGTGEAKNSLTPNSTPTQSRKTRPKSNLFVSLLNAHAHTPSVGFLQLRCLILCSSTLRGKLMTIERRRRKLSSMELAAADPSPSNRCVSALWLTSFQTVKSVVLLKIRLTNDLIWDRRKINRFYNYRSVYVHI